MSISLDEIRAMFRAENAAMLEKALQRMESASAAMPEKTLQRMESASAAMPENTVKKLEGVIDEKLDLMKETSALQKQADQLERRIGDNVVQEVKRRRCISAETGNDGMDSNAREHAALRRHDDKERHAVVFSGFPAKSRRKPVIDYVVLQFTVAERLAGQADVCDLGDKVFTPNIRTRVWSLIRNPLHKAHVFRIDTVALQHNSFVSCHRTVALEHSSNASALAQACREKHSVFAHVHNRKEIFLTW